MFICFFVMMIYCVQVNNKCSVLFCSENIVEKRENDQSVYHTTAKLMVSCINITCTKFMV